MKPNKKIRKIFFLINYLYKFCFVVNTSVRVMVYFGFIDVMDTMRVFGKLIWWIRFAHGVIRARFRLRLQFKHQIKIISIQLVKELKYLDINNLLGWPVAVGTLVTATGHPGWCSVKMWNISALIRNRNERRKSKEDTKQVYQWWKYTHWWNILRPYALVSLGKYSRYWRWVYVRGDWSFGLVDEE